MKIIKNFVGNSGSTIQLIENNKKTIVRKTKNIEKNLEKYEFYKRMQRSFYPN